jgi:hypothetical protein
MSTKLNAEELAAKRFPYAIPGVMDDIERQRQINTYALAIREVAQPIADQRDELLEALQLLPLDAFKEDGKGADAADFKDNARHFIAAMDAARAAIAKCTPKP